jgi:hypothetical protein
MRRGLSPHHIFEKLQQQLRDSIIDPDEGVDLTA